MFPERNCSTLNNIIFPFSLIQLYNSFLAVHQERRLQKSVTQLRPSCNKKGSSVILIEERSGNRKNFLREDRELPGIVSVALSFLSSCISHSFLLFLYSLCVILLNVILFNLLRTIEQFVCRSNDSRQEFSNIVRPTFRLYRYFISNLLFTRKT